MLIEDITEQRQAEKEKAASAAAAASTLTAASPDDVDEGEDSQRDVLPSDERLLDAQEIERVAATVTRGTAKLHLTSLVAKLKREAEALQRMEKSRHLLQSSTTSSNSSPSSSKPRAAAAAAVAAAAADENADPTAPSSNILAGATSVSVAADAADLSSSPKPLPLTSSTASTAAPGYYVPVDRFGFDAGGYNAPFVTLYVDLPGVGQLDRAQDIHCDFGVRSVDLIVRNLRGKSYRLLRDNLDKDIDPEKSKIVVKSDKIIVKLAKKKSEYGSYDYWTALSSKKKTKPTGGGAGEKEDPSASIMQMMKDMYDDGDDNIRKVIGETMLKQRTGELGKDPLMRGGGGGLGGSGLGDDGDGDGDDF
jgi:calcyclin binding protein